MLTFDEVTLYYVQDRTLKKVPIQEDWYMTGLFYSRVSEQERPSTSIHKTIRFDENANPVSSSHFPGSDNSMQSWWRCTSEFADKDKDTVLTGEDDRTLIVSTPDPSWDAEHYRLVLKADGEVFVLEGWYDATPRLTFQNLLMKVLVLNNI